LEAFFFSNRLETRGNSVPLLVVKESSFSLFEEEEEERELQEEGGD
jgi:hypothetical protein